MPYKYVIYQRDGNIARVTLNRPDKLNAWDFPCQGGISDDFYKVIEEAAEDDEIKVLIIKAAGRAFSAGHDLNTVGFIYGMGTGQPGERRSSQRIRLKVDRHWLLGGHGRLLYFPKVTIAQVHGYCLGEGLIVAECCDIAICADDAKIGHADQRMGFGGGGMGMVPLLILSVGLKRAREILLTGRHMSGKEAAEIGLMTKSVPPDKLEEAVEEMAKTICLLPRDGIAIGKTMTEMVYDSLGLTHGLIAGYIGHTIFTNLRWEPDEYNFLRHRREKGVTATIHARDDRYKGLVEDVSK